ncbi:hypothetical protein OC835_005352 [Tilletia horrida]|nr:hypothetical protein OC835_005352 [Tilletia horrida]
MSSSSDPDNSLLDAVRVVLRHSHGQYDGDLLPSGVDSIAVAALKTAKSLDAGGPSLRAAVSKQLREHFHMFEPRQQPSVRGVLARWIPNTNSTPAAIEDYFAYHLGPARLTSQDLFDQIEAFDRYEAGSAHSIKVDARIPGVSALSHAAIYGPLCFPQWMACMMLVCRVGIPNPNLKHLHLRLSANSAIITRVEHIISTNSQLVDVVLEVDHPINHPADHRDRPALDLSKVAHAADEYATMQRFILRAPGLDLGADEYISFSRRIRGCSTMAIAVHSILQRTPVWQWSMHLLRGMDRVERIEISVALDLDACQPLPRNFSTMNLTCLTHLTLEFSDISAAFLQNLEAPLLKFIRIKTASPLNSRGSCTRGHFPALYSATVHCPGLIIRRFRTLGLATRQFSHCLEPGTVEEDEYDGEVTCVGITQYEHLIRDDFVRQREDDDDDIDSVDEPMSP